MVKSIEKALRDLAIPDKAHFYPKFFKAGKGEYAEGDRFLGVVVPEQKKVAKAFFKDISLDEMKELLRSPFHEMRLTALFMLVLKFEKSKIQSEKKNIVDFYLQNLQFVNNWDLVDSTAYKILGCYAFQTGEHQLIYNLAGNENMWAKRIAIVSTMYFLKQKQTAHTKAIALQNINHPHDLIHKANGWLLREMGKVNEEELLEFLKAHYTKLPRTTLRYAIEKLDPDMRQTFLKGDF